MADNENIVIDGQISLLTQKELKAMERGDCDESRVDSD